MFGDEMKAKKPKPMLAWAVMKEEGYPIAAIYRTRKGAAAHRYLGETCRVVRVRIEIVEKGGGR